MFHRRSARLICGCQDTICIKVFDVPDTIAVVYRACGSMFDCGWMLRPAISLLFDDNAAHLLKLLCNADLR